MKYFNETYISPILFCRKIHTESTVILPHRRLKCIDEDSLLLKSNDEHIVVNFLFKPLYFKKNLTLNSNDNKQQGCFSAISSATCIEVLDMERLLVLTDYFRFFSFDTAIPRENQVFYNSPFLNNPDLFICLFSILDCYLQILILSQPSSDSDSDIAFRFQSHVPNSLLLVRGDDKPSDYKYEINYFYIFDSKYFNRIRLSEKILNVIDSLHTQSSSLKSRISDCKSLFKENSLERTYKDIYLSEVENFHWLSVFPDDMLSFLVPHYTFIELDYSEESLLLEFAETQGVKVPFLSHFVHRKSEFCYWMNLKTPSKINEENVFLMLNNDEKWLIDNDSISHEGLFKEIIDIRRCLNSCLNINRSKFIKSILKTGDIEKLLQNFHSVEETVESQSQKNHFYQIFYIQSIILTNKTKLRDFLKSKYTSYVNTCLQKKKYPLIKVDPYSTPSILFYEKGLLFFVFDLNIQKFFLGSWVKIFNETSLIKYTLKTKTSVPESCVVKNSHSYSSLTQFENLPSFMDFLTIHLLFKKISHNNPEVMLSYIDFALNISLQSLLEPKNRDIMHEKHNSVVEHSEEHFLIFLDFRYLILRYVLLKVLSRNGLKKYSSLKEIKKLLSKHIYSITFRKFVL